jgi:chitodextrinase
MNFILVLLLTALLPASLALGSFPDRVFAPYVDVLLYPPFSIKETHEKTGQKYFTLAFVVSGGGCEPAWGGVVAMEDDHYMKETNAIRSVGGDVIVSFGGAAGTELAISCTDVDRLQAAYQSVIDRYDLKWVDFDIEGFAVAERTSIDRRNKAIQGLQAANPDLKIAFCLPVLPSGLTPDGLYVLENAVANGVRIDVVNVMAMDYGDWAAPDPEGKMGQYAIDAGNNTRSQVLERGIDAEIGITPMIGQNDVGSERFYVSDAEQLYSWASTKDWVTLLSMWSTNRDNNDCPGQPHASPFCSGVSQADFEFVDTFKAFPEGGDGGNIYPDVDLTNPADGSAFDEGDDIVITAEAADPDGTVAQVEFFEGTRSLGIDTQSPYSISWQGVPKGVYELTAVATDNDGATRRSQPVQISVGLVCISPAWDASEIYLNGDVVSHQGNEWQAKWWTRGEKPGTTGIWGVWNDLGPCAPDDNTPPTVTILTPAEGDTFVEGDTVTLEAEAADANGSVTRVEFFQGSVSLGVVAAAPYRIAWNNVSEGSYELTAEATDDYQATTQSSPVHIEVIAEDNGDCSYPQWDPDQNWTTYKVGDRRVNAGKVWECTNIAYSYLEPSGPWGHFGWTFVQDCP